MGKGEGGSVPVNVRGEGEDHALLLDLPVHDHLGGDGAGISDRLGHGGVAVGLPVADLTLTDFIQFFLTMKFRFKLLLNF